MNKFNCPTCGRGIISYKSLTESVSDSYGTSHLINIIVGVCDNCGEKVYPKESALMIERILKPEKYTLEIPGDIVDQLIINAKKKGIDFRRYALEKLSE